MSRTTPRVHFGPFEVDWDTFGVVVSHIGVDTGEHISLPRAQHSLDAVRKLVQDGDCSLLKLVCLLVDSHATEVKDNVYSLLGLTGNREADLVAATYDDGIAAAFAKATYASIITSGTYGILGFLNFANPRPPRVRTWALKFSRVGDRHFKTQLWNRKVNRKSKSRAWTGRTETCQVPQLIFN